MFTVVERVIEPGPNLIVDVRNYRSIVNLNDIKINIKKEDQEAKKGENIIEGHNEGI